MAARGRRNPGGRQLGGHAAGAPLCARGARVHHQLANVMDLGVKAKWQGEGWGEAPTQEGRAGQGRGQAARKDEEVVSPTPLPRALVLLLVLSTSSPRDTPGAAELLSISTTAAEDHRQHRGRSARVLRGGNRGHTSGMALAFLSTLGLAVYSASTSVSRNR